MKKSLSFILAIALVFTMAASAFAAEPTTTSDSSATTTSATYTTQEKYDQLVAAGIFEGDEDGLPHLDAKMTRAQFAKILAKVFGLSEDAATASKAYSDLDGASWAAGFIGAVTKAGLMEGDAGKFMPSADVTTEQLATVLVRAFDKKPVAGAKVPGAADWAAGYVQAALDAKLIPAAADYTKAALRGALVEAGYAAYVEITKPTPTPTVKPTPTPTPAALTSVNTISNTRIETVFSNVYTSALTAADFAVKSSAGAEVAVKSVAVRADNTKVFVNTDAMTAGSSYTVTVGGASQTFVAKPADTTAPTVIYAQAITPQLIRVAFPTDTDADTLVAANFTLNNNLKVTNAVIDTDFNASAANQNGNKYVAVLLSTETQTAGTLYTVTVNNVKDLNGNAITSNSTANFAGAAADTTAPAVLSAVASSKGYVTVNFTEPSQLDVASATNVANYTVTGFTVSKVVINKNVLGSSTAGDKSVRVYLNEKLTSGNLYTISVNNVADILGNKQTAASSANFAGVAIDTTALKLQTAVANSNTVVKLTFDDIVADGATDIANYTIAGLTISAAAYDTSDAGYDATSKQGPVILLTTTAQVAGTLYTAKVANLKDNMGNGLDASYVQANFAGVPVDATAPSVVSATAQAKQVQVTFNEQLDKASAENVLNYVIDNNIGYPTAATLDSTKKIVTLSVGELAAGTLYKVTVSNVKDLAGNVVGSTNNTTFPGVASASTVKPSSVIALNNKQIQIVFNQPIAQTAATVLATLKIARTDAAAVAADPSGVQAVNTYATLDGTPNAVIKSDGVTVVVTLDTTHTLASTGLYSIETTTTGKYGALADAVANTHVAFAGTSVARPDITVAAATPVDLTHVKLTFSEELSSATFGALAGTDITFVQDDNTANVIQTSGTALDPNNTRNVIVTTTTALTPDKVYRIQLTSTGAAIFKAKDTIYSAKTDNSTVAEGYLTTTGAAAVTKINVSVAQQVESNIIDVTFDKDIAAINANAYDTTVTGITVTTDTGAAITAAVAGVKTDASKPNVLHVYLTADLAGSASGVYKITFGGASLNAVDYAYGAVDLSVSGATVSAVFANAVASATPVINTVLAVSGTVAKVTFSETLKDAAALTTADFVLKDANGNVIPSTLHTSVANADANTAISAATTQIKDLYIRIDGGAGTFAQGQNYKVTIKSTNSMTDLAGNALTTGADVDKVFSGISVADSTIANIAVAGNTPIQVTPESGAGANGGFEVNNVGGVTPTEVVRFEYYLNTVAAAAPDASAAATGTTVYFTASNLADNYALVSNLTIGTAGLLTKDVYVRTVDVAGNKSAWVKIAE